MSLGFAFNSPLNDQWRSAVDAHKTHAKAEWPREACGLIDGAGGYHACENVAEDPVRQFEIAHEQLMQVDEGRPTALLHSHVALKDAETGKTMAAEDGPSSADMRCQMDMAIPWGITMCAEDGATDPFWFGDQVPRPPLIGRVFRHGVLDCYSLIRDWHRDVAGIILPDYPRDAFWWEDGADLYSQFESAGFSRVYRDRDPAPGDVFLCKIRSPVMNHGGIYIGNGLLLHHLQFQLSMRAPASIWRPKLDFLVRHRDLPEGWAE